MRAGSPHFVAWVTGGSSTSESPMRLRILLAIVGVTALACSVLTIPLAVFAARNEHERTVREMSLEAQEVLIHVLRDGQFDPDNITLASVDWNLEAAIYRLDDSKAAGDGPDQADFVTARAVLLPTNQRVDGAVIYAQPIVVQGEKVATIRISEMTPWTGRRITRALLALVAFNALAVVAAALIGAFVASRLSRPVRRLRDDAVRLGTGDFAISPRRTGIREIDETSTALSDTAERLGEILQREREFTTNSSHQLRTPLTSLRLLLESELAVPRPDPAEAVSDALDEVDRLQATITTMLEVARGAPTPRAPLDLDSWARDVRDRWAHSEDTVEVTSGRGTASVSRAVLDQIVDVLITNAVQHGEGTISVSVGVGDGRLVVSVSDHGSLARNPAELFRRHDPDAAGHGVGLALARMLAEAEGGRLVLESSQPTTFRLSLPNHRPVDSAP